MPGRSDSARYEFPGIEQRMLNAPSPNRRQRQVGRIALRQAIQGDRHARLPKADLVLFKTQFPPVDQRPGSLPFLA
jgi:hypothetical protein